MKKELINEDKLNILLKIRNKYIFVSLALFILWISWSVGSCFIQTRETMKIFIAVNSVISILIVIFFLYMICENFIPLGNKIKLFRKSLERKKTTNKVKSISFQKEKENFLGVESFVYYFSDANKEESKFKIFSSEEVNVIEGEMYVIEYYHNYLVSITEVNENE